MTPSRNIGVIVAINIQLLFAAACGFGAWAVWPSSPYWWGLGVLGIMLALACLGGISNALRLARELYAKERALADYLAQGGAPKQASLATDAQLRNAGMIE
ncbi:hypothetical protein [Mesorhizobium sp. J428]|uniref:hypothetical protein n=1 Tax=Mesorhizobium sp. J428 TaxID=2898440 RepID=UPI0021519B5E|nr:hypothetical protein [Mesorhizobium sp. J428]MCR5858266.1 hypothetical protein [Mesorhizobium sp. J428]